MTRELSLQDVELLLRRARESQRNASVTGESLQGEVSIEITADGAVKKVRIDTAVFERGDAAAVGEAVIQAVKKAGDRLARDTFDAMLPQATHGSTSSLASAAAIRSSAVPPGPAAPRPPSTAPTSPAKPPKRSR